MIFLRRAAACGLLASAIACPAPAGAIATNPPTFGPIFQVTRDDQTCQHAPVAAALPGSGFAVAWTAGYPSAAFLRFGDAQGRLPAPEIRTADRQVETLGTDAAGTVSVIWRSQVPALSLQRFSASGQALGAEVALPIPPPPGKLAAAFAPDGRFAAVWQAGNRVLGRWFSATGLPLGTEFEIEPAAGSSVPTQGVAATLDASGHLAAAWSALLSPAIQAVRFRRFDSQGAALGPAVDVGRDALGPGFDRSPAIAATGDGGLTLAWERIETIPLASGLHYRSFNASDQPEGPAGAVGFPNDGLPVIASDGAHRVALAWQHNDGTAWMAMLPAVPGAEPPPATPLNPELEPGSGLVQTAALTFLTDGRLAAFWDDYAPPNVLPTGCDYRGIFGRLVDPDPDFRPAQTTGPEKGLSDFTGEAGLAPALTVTQGGGFVAVWQTGDPGLVVSRAFDAAGNPSGPETVIDPSSTRLRDIAVTTLADGTLIAAWAQFNASTWNVTFRHLDAAGQPLGLAHNAGPPGARMPVVAARGEGFLLGWSAGPPYALAVQPFHTDGTAAGAPVQIGLVANGSFYALTAIPGGFLVSWNTVATELLAQRLTDLGAPAGAVFTVWSDPVQPQVLPRLAALPGGGVAIAWSAFLAPFHFAAGARVRRFGPDDRPWEDPVDAETLRVLFPGDENQSLYVHALGASRDGTLWLLLGTDSASRETRLAVLAVRDGVPAGPPVPVGSTTTNSGGGGLFRFGSLAADACGWLAAWSAVVNGGGGGDYRSFAQRATGGCLAGPPTLRLGADGRFRASISWRTPLGTAGIGNPRRLADDSGALWFFAPNNPELMLKVLDGRGVNGAFWVFYATLTDVAFDLTVTDTETGKSRTYSKPQGRLESRADVNAFPAAGAGSVPAAALLAPRPEPSASSPCPAGASALCLAGRFNVGIHFTDPRDHSDHDAVPIPLTADAGSFWFFGPDNLEMLVKIVDGRPVNQKWWFFYGALSTVDYDITVTDTQTGALRVYRNRHGALTSSADTGAFP